MGGSVMAMPSVERSFVESKERRAIDTLDHVQRKLELMKALGGDHPGEVCLSDDAFFGLVIIIDEIIVQLKDVEQLISNRSKE
jgi:hypothetical protein